MQTVYRISNPAQGLYIETDSIESAKEAMIKQALEFYLQHTHQNPISVVEIDDVGAETWRNLSSDEMRRLPYEEYLISLRNLLNAS